MGRSKPKKDSDGPAKTSFWTTLPGLLTAAAGFIGAVTALLLAILKFTGSPEGAPAPSAQQQWVFEIARAHDGFAALRVQPTMQSAQLVEIPIGVRVHCGDPVVDATGKGFYWRPCFDSAGHSGFISDYLLERVQG